MLSHAAYLPYGNSFAIIGGAIRSGGPGNTLDTVYVYDVSANRWRLVEGSKLSKPLLNVQAVSLRDAKLPQC